MIIRQATERDRAIYLEMSAEFYSSPAVLSDIPAAYRERSFDEFLRGTYACCFILEEDAPVGYGVVSFFYSQEAGGLCTVIDELYIRHGFRSRGYGRQFFRFVFKNFPSPRYMLDVEPENARARALYERLGFLPSGYVRMTAEGADCKGGQNKL